jgi:hypothetical protein
MSVSHVKTVLSTARRNAGFAAQLATDAALLTGYDLTPEESRALVEGDTDALRAMGIDDELLKALGEIAVHR